MLMRNHFQFSGRLPDGQTREPNPVILSYHKLALAEEALARYNLTSVELKIFTFSAGSKSRFIDNGVLDPLP